MKSCTRQIDKADFMTHLIFCSKEMWANWPEALLTNEQKIEILAFNLDRPIDYFKDRDMSIFF